MSAPKSTCPDCRQLKSECPCLDDDDLYQVGDGDDYHGAEGLEILRVPAEGAPVNDQQGESAG